MSRSNSIKAKSVTLFFLIFLTVPVNSVKNLIIFEPTKMFLQCKSTKYPRIQEFIDLTNLSMFAAGDNSQYIEGYVVLIADVTDAPVSVGIKKLFYVF